MKPRVTAGHNRQQSGWYGILGESSKEGKNMVLEILNSTVVQVVSLVTMVAAYVANFVPKDTVVGKLIHWLGANFKVGPEKPKE